MIRWLALVMLAGCLVPSAGVDAGASGNFQCDESQPSAERTLRRLSRKQYVAVVDELISRSGISLTDQADVRRALRDELSPFPSDRVVGVPNERHGGFERLDQALQQGHVDTSYSVAVALARELTSTPQRRIAMAGPCAETPNDAQCLRNLATRFGRLVHRRPLSDDDVTFYSSGSYADAIALLLTAPQFLYHLEPNELDGYALASRLSFHFWQTMPDETLFAAAADGSLLTDDGYRAQVERLFADARTNATLDDFFGQWWRLDELAPLNTRLGTPVFDAFIDRDIPSETLHLEMQEEVLDVARDVTRREAAVSELLTSRRFVTKSPALAQLYGQAAWNGVDAPVEFVHAERHGLLTRAALLATAGVATRPIMKGYRVRNALLCLPVPPPPNGASATPIPLEPNLTTREVVERVTEQSGTSCAGCHATLLNPLGFVTENFDALGRRRTHQRLFSESGQVLAEREVSTQTTVSLGEKEVAVSDAAGVQREMRGAFQTCFARQAFRFTYQRIEDDVRDGCALRALDEAAASGASVASLFKAAALRPEFRR